MLLPPIGYIEDNPNRFFDFRVFVAGSRIRACGSLIPSSCAPSAIARVSPAGNNCDQHDVDPASFRQMEKSEQRFVVKFFFLKGLVSKPVRTNLIAVLSSTD
jgi:hypothetical protein